MTPLEVIIIITIIGAVVALLLKYITHPKTSIIITNDDHTARLVKNKIKIKDNALACKHGVWLLTEKSTPLNVKSFWGTTSYYITSPDELHPKIVTSNTVDTEAPNATTLKQFSDNTLMQQILYYAKNEMINIKLILILFLIIGAVIAAYFVFVAPNMVPKDSVITIMNATATYGGF